MPGEYDVRKFLESKGLPATPQNMQQASQYLSTSPNAVAQLRRYQQMETSEVGAQPDTGWDWPAAMDNAAQGKSYSGSAQTGAKASSNASKGAVAPPEKPGASKTVPSGGGSGGSKKEAVEPPEKPSPNTVQPIEGDSEEFDWSWLLPAVGAASVKGGAMLAGDPNARAPADIAEEVSRAVAGGQPGLPAQSVSGTLPAENEYTIYIDDGEGERPMRDITPQTQQLSAEPTLDELDAPQQMLPAPDGVNAPVTSGIDGNAFVEQVNKMAPGSASIDNRGWVSMDTPNGRVRFHQKMLSDPTRVRELMQTLGPQYVRKLVTMFRQVM